MLCKQISDMNLDELVASVYICNKHDHNPIKCIDCSNLVNCPGGKRAVEILDNMTSTGMTTQRKSSITRHSQYRELVKKAIESGNPIKYFMEEEGAPTNAAARIRLSRAKKSFPDLFGMEAVEKNRRGHIEENYKKALESGNPIKWYMNTFGIQYDAAYQRFIYAKTKLSKNSNDVKACENKPTESEDEDDISLDDFLNQHDSFLQISNDENETKENDDFSSLLDAKYKKLLEERKALQKRIAWYDQAIESLDQVRKIF